MELGAENPELDSAAKAQWSHLACARDYGPCALVEAHNIGYPCLPKEYWIPTEKRFWLFTTLARVSHMWWEADEMILSTRTLAGYTRFITQFILTVLRLCRVIREKRGERQVTQRFIHWILKKRAGYYNIITRMSFTYCDSVTVLPLPKTLLPLNQALFSMEWRISFTDFMVLDFYFDSFSTGSLECFKFYASFLNIYACIQQF
jgi:hypothetical protein